MMHDIEIIKIYLRWCVSFCPALLMVKYIFNKCIKNKRATFNFFFELRKS